ncbi:MAG: hypothetical protein NT046_04205 [Arenimonas sp.]|nr:hypothetical protein [Arenimonas sp.]
MRMTIFLAGLLLGLAAPAGAAINPAEYQRVASDVLRIRETARIVEELDVGGDRLRRTTLVGEVLEQGQARGPMVGKTVVIDYTVNLTQREKAGRDHATRSAGMVGPQFVHDPDPPALDADGAYWANLAPAGGRLGNVNRHAGAVVGMVSNAFSGEVYVPVAGQYSFDPPPR